nr:hypothetical protein [Heliobacterium chlorum]
MSLWRLEDQMCLLSFIIGFLNTLQGLPDVQYPPIKINILPAEAQQFPST